MYAEIKVMQADMLNLPFNSQCFDVVIEKGTMVKPVTKLKFPFGALFIDDFRFVNVVLNRIFSEMIIRESS